MVTRSVQQQMLDTPGNARDVPQHWLGNLLVAAAALLLAVPTIYGFSIVYWMRASDTHAPVVLAAIVYAFWLERSAFDWSSSSGARLWAILAAAPALLLYVTGRSLEFYQLEGLGLVCFVTALVLMVSGFHGLRRLGFLCFLLLFVVPIPNTAADAMLVPLKKVLSEGVVWLFQFFDYPVANHGVVLAVGFYQLQIADACAGLRSLLALIAIGFMFIYFVPSRRRAVNVWLLVLVPLIALGANFLRICALVLVTYYFGGDKSEAAHNFIGLLEIGIALGMFSAAHAVLERLLDPVPVRSV